MPLTSGMTLYKSLSSLSLRFLVYEKPQGLDEKINVDGANLGPWHTKDAQSVRAGVWGPEGRVLTAVALSITAEIGVVFVRLALVQVCVIGNQVFRWLLRDQAVRARMAAGQLRQVAALVCRGHHHHLPHPAPGHSTRAPSRLEPGETTVGTGDLGGLESCCCRKGLTGTPKVRGQKRTWAERRAPGLPLPPAQLLLKPHSHAHWHPQGPTLHKHSLTITLTHLHLQTTDAPRDTQTPTHELAPNGLPSHALQAPRIHTHHRTLTP